MVSEMYPHLWAECVFLSDEGREWWEMSETLCVISQKGIDGWRVKATSSIRDVSITMAVMTICGFIFPWWWWWRENKQVFYPMWNDTRWEWGLWHWRMTMAEVFCLHPTRRLVLVLAGSSRLQPHSRLCLNGEELTVGWCSNLGRVVEENKDIGYTFVYCKIICL